ncbi:hypothetical protein FHX42_004991 [Saccharopolyspora lacisalsi]|uniref:Uncharacterized protein n=1 Tax=Halosaccharopolyspora lacisalsi TaxID=1000566 RepID=A0A839E6S0_9PSEU|nr:hypothetical protein [Halosaccharopolyspora lacisalsi]MBA8827595.1 hypothetical protein [Halosaccharopolyspora lacisalsi]
MRTDETARLTDTVQRLATVVDSVLRGGADHDGLLDDLPEAEHDTVVLAAARALEADLLAPRLLTGHTIGSHDLAVIRAALRAFPPAADSSPVSAWSHWPEPCGSPSPVWARNGPRRNPTPPGSTGSRGRR